MARRNKNARTSHKHVAVEELVALYRAAAGEHPDWDEYRAAMRTHLSNSRERRRRAQVQAPARGTPGMA